MRAVHVSGDFENRGDLCGRPADALLHIRLARGHRGDRHRQPPRRAVHRHLAVAQPQARQQRGNALPAQPGTLSSALWTLPWLHPCAATQNAHGACLHLKTPLGLSTGPHLSCATAACASTGGSSSQPISITKSAAAAPAASSALSLGGGGAAGASASPSGYPSSSRRSSHSSAWTYAVPFHTATWRLSLTGCQRLACDRGNRVFIEISLRAGPCATCKHRTAWIWFP